MSNKDLITKALAKADAAVCHLCGCTGIHACPGHPIIWTEDDKLRLDAALKKIFNKEQQSNE